MTRRPNPLARTITRWPPLPSRPSRPSRPLLLLATVSLAGCARQAAGTVSHAPDTPGLLLGIWHGFIFPAAWLLSLFVPDVAVYAVPNNGGWYDFGYFVGIVILGVGARKTRTVTVVKWRDR